MVDPYVAGNVVVIDSHGVVRVVIVVLKVSGRELDKLKRIAAVGSVTITENHVVTLTGHFRALAFVLLSPECPCKIVFHGHCRNSQVGTYVCAATVVTIKANNHAALRVVNPNRAAIA